MANTINSWNNQVLSANVTFNGGTHAIGTDATDNLISIGTVANAGRSISIGNVTGTSALTLAAGSGKINITGFAEGALLTNATGQVATATGTAGWVLTANAAGTAPSFQAVPSSAFPWADTTVNASLVVNHGYVANKAGLLTMTLPATAAIGDTIRITGINTAVGWRIAQNANQQIFFGTSSTSVGVGGYLEATEIRDSVELICVGAGASTVYNVVSSQGNITIV
jgi:hypothetical protein